MDYTRNDDKLCAARRRVFNKYLVESPLFSSEGAESVTLAEVKEHLNILHADQDAYLTKLIKRWRARAEKYKGIGLITRTVTDLFDNSYGGIKLRYGPVTSFSSMSDINGNAIALPSYTLRSNGGEYWLESPTSNYLKVVYVAGYTAATITEDLKDALIQCIAYGYANRGDKMEESLNAVVAQYFGRNTWLL